MKNVLTILLDGVAHGTIKRIVVGINWTFVEAENGCGLAQTPRRDAPGCQPIADAGNLTRLSLRQLALLIESTNPMEVAIGMAAINASYNRLDLDVEYGNGLDVFGQVDQSVTVVGRFPRLEERYLFLKVIEKEPCEGEFPESMAKEILQSSRHSIITSSTFVNGTAENMISYAENGQIAIVGPGTPFCPGLFKLGVNVLSGLIIDDPQAASRVVAEGGAVQGLKDVARYANIRSG